MSEERETDFVGARIKFPKQRAKFAVWVRVYAEIWTWSAKEAWPNAGVAETLDNS